MDRIIARMKKSSGRRGDGTPVRRLERRHAARNINYDAASSSTSSSIEDLSVSTTSLMTRSLEFPDPTSFRIGGGDGEMDRIYRSIGVSGPEDLAISSDAWEASKKRSASDIIDRVKSFDLDDHKVMDLDLCEAGPSGAVVDDDDTDLTRLIGNSTELTRSKSSEIGNFTTPVDEDVVDGGIVENKRGFERAPTILVKSKGYLVPNDLVVVGAGMVENKRSIERTPTILVKSKGYLVPNDAVAVGGGIKGLRPPVLKPPPSMKRPPIDHQGSSWDFLTHFAPKSETDKRPSSSSSSDNGDEEEAREDEEEAREDAVFIQLGDTADEACSFTTNEGDSSSTVSNTSPIFASGGSIITSWQKGQLLGRGSFGSVYEGISGDGDFFAVKEVSLLDQDSQAQECIQQLEGEIALLSKLQHQNIVRYRGTARDESNLYIFLELVTQGSLLKLYQRYQRLQNSVVSGYTRQILDGLKYLHDNSFIHRDIKCANILVDANGAVKLADFGLAKVSKLNDIKSCKGTPFWMAPEVINRKGNDGYGTPADIWSLGCTVLEMLTSQIPYGNLEPVQALFRIGRGKLPEVPETLSLDAQHFILKCLKVNPEERPTAAELLNHPFVRRPLTSLGSGGPGSASPRLLR
ncbi:Mitogen-activated protein kinase kinase kinase 1 [Cardamine amara subsp. amara]|uniref:mitogen-activated protein kinase kinase kinase n=1 Tax=Cardamine amara subsp. amara TaxID=228776 RepID=A0ABD1B6X3_CARAN